MARPKTTVSNNKKHLTKTEIKEREETEKASVTGIQIRERDEVSKNSVAHSEFERVIGILNKVNKNDAIIETVINRYCLLLSECLHFECMREKFEKNLDELINSDLDVGEKYKLEASMQKSVLDIDKQIQTKRRMLFDIERENGMTIAATLRNIPAKSNNEENPLLKALREDA